MAIFLQELVNGITTGALCTLLALSFTMVYKVLKLLNFAQAPAAGRIGTPPGAPHIAPPSRIILTRPSIPERSAPTRPTASPDHLAHLTYRTSPRPTPGNNRSLLGYARRLTQAARRPHRQVAGRCLERRSSCTASTVPFASWPGCSPAP